MPQPVHRVVHVYFGIYYKGLEDVVLFYFFFYFFFVFYALIFIIDDIQVMKKNGDDIFALKLTEF